MSQSQFPGFYRLPVPERQALLHRPELAPDLETFVQVLNSGGMSVEQAASIVENVVGVYSLPFSVALNFRVNDRDRLVPMVVEEPSVVAAASNAAKMVREGGGFHAELATNLLIAQVELRKITSTEAALGAIHSKYDDLLNQARAAVPGLVARGRGPVRIEVRTIGPGHLVVHILLDTADAMGANLANRVAEALGPTLAELTQAELGLCILSNLCDERLVHVEANVPLAALVRSGDVDEGAAVARSIEAASIFAERDPYRAATHNKGIMNGVDSVLVATGNDYRAVEAGAHAYATRSGSYRPLATWRATSSGLHGVLEMPLAVGTVGGTLRVHPTARLALALAGIERGPELAILAGAAGLASNLAALRALSTEGILRGHMALHARSLALLVGASPGEVDQVARKMVELGDISDEGARKSLALCRTEGQIQETPPRK
jgi:hydroxymethylglutaryl-CoA reductase